MKFRQVCLGWSCKKQLLASYKVTHNEPSAVPRIVCGLKNLQQASFRSKSLSANGRSDPEAPTPVQACQHNKSKISCKNQK